jgi:tetratricopeptide (TPR) repeat protein
MTDKKLGHDADSSEVLIAKAKDFWEKNSKVTMIVGAAIIILVGGYFGYKSFVLKPKEIKAADAMFRAEEYYRMDSVNLALNGDGQFPGFLSVISKFGGTDASNLAHFYAGSCYLKSGDDQNAIKHLKKFSSSSKQIQARAYKLLGDAYAGINKNTDALDYYKKAAHHFEKDENNSADYLFMAANFAHKVMNDPKEAIALYKELKEKFPRTQKGFQADMYLVQLGVYKTEN